MVKDISVKDTMIQKKKWKLYLGSGKILKDAIKKYGRDNFTVEILENCKTKELLNDREKYWIKKI